MIILRLELVILIPTLHLFSLAAPTLKMFLASTIHTAGMVGFESLI